MDGLVARYGRQVAEFDLRSSCRNPADRREPADVLALIGDPEIAVLDELTTGPDPQARRGTWSVVEGVRDRGVTVVLVTRGTGRGVRVHRDRHRRDRAVPA